MAAGLYRFRFHERLHFSAEYQRVKKAGKHLRTRHFSLNLAENGLPYHRLGIVVQKRYWQAIERNHIKRRLREWFRLNKSQIPPPGKDIVAIPRPGAERLNSTDMAAELREALLDIG